jgi:hypothetical protein
MGSPWHELHRKPTESGLELRHGLARTGADALDSAAMEPAADEAAGLLERLILPAGLSNPLRRPRLPTRIRPTERLPASW